MLAQVTLKNLRTAQRRPDVLRSHFIGCGWYAIGMEDFSPEDRKFFTISNPWRSSACMARCHGIYGTLQVAVQETWLSADNFMDRSLEYRWPWREHCWLLGWVKTTKIQKEFPRNAFKNSSNYGRIPLGQCWHSDHIGRMCNDTALVASFFKHPGCKVAKRFFTKYSSILWFLAKWEPELEICRSTSSIINVAGTWHHYIGPSPSLALSGEACSFKTGAVDLMWYFSIADVHW